MVVINFAIELWETKDIKAEDHVEQSRRARTETNHPCKTGRVEHYA